VVLKSLPQVVFFAAALASVSAFGAVPRDGFHPLAVLASLLPLQLVAVVWTLRNRNVKS
jgi:hypothetical protein